jgi:hypothetical protein
MNISSSSHVLANAINTSAVRFHANGSLLLAGGEDKYLRFFRIDGETNEKQLSKLQFPIINDIFLL